jgi:hypothetical protein
MMKAMETKRVGMEQGLIVKINPRIRQKVFDWGRVFEGGEPLTVQKS